MFISQTWISAPDMFIQIQNQPFSPCFTCTDPKLALQPLLCLCMSQNYIPVTALPVQIPNLFSFPCFTCTYLKLEFQPLLYLYIFIHTYILAPALLVQNLNLHFSHCTHYWPLTPISTVDIHSWLKISHNRLHSAHKEELHVTLNTDQNAPFHKNIEQFKL